MGRAAALLLIIAAAVLGGWWWLQPAPVVETPAAAQRQADGSDVLERAPTKSAKPAHQIPKGAKVERTVSVTVKPKEGPPAMPGLKAPADGLKPGPAACPPLKVDLSLVRLPDRTKRVVASSPNGEIVGGLDVPVETAAPPEEPARWAAGLSADPIHRLPGLWVERDVGRLRLGAEINRVRVLAWGPDGTQIRLRVGMTF